MHSPPRIGINPCAISIAASVQSRFTDDIGLEEIEWLWTTDDPNDERDINPQAPGPSPCPGQRHCGGAAIYSGTLSARGYANGLLKEIVVGHITVQDELIVTVTPSYGPSGYEATATATKSDGSPIDKIWGWQFHPDSNVHTKIADPCGAVNPCVFHPTVSGWIEVHTTIGNQGKQKRAHVTVVPCPQDDSNQDNPEFRELERLVWDNSNASDINQNNRMERAGVLLDSAGVRRTELLPLSSDTSKNGPCSWASSWQPPSGWNIAALVHSHPFQDGEIFNAAKCPIGQQYGYRTTGGWASGADWHTSGG